MAFESHHELRGSLRSWPAESGAEPSEPRSSQAGGRLVAFAASELSARFERVLCSHRVGRTTVRVVVRNVLSKEPGSRAASYVTPPRVGSLLVRSFSFFRFPSAQQKSGRTDTHTDRRTTAP